MYAIMLNDEKSYKGIESGIIRIEEKDIDGFEGLLVAWLERFLYDFDTRQLVYSDICIRYIKIIGGIGKIVADSIIGVAKPDMIKLGIKAVTYQDLHIKEDDGVYKGRVIFDV
jgi:SHS2 domain-containing protein